MTAVAAAPSFSRSRRVMLFALIRVISGNFSLVLPACPSSGPMPSRCKRGLVGSRSAGPRHSRSCALPPEPLRAESATFSQPRATPWEICRPTQGSPERASYTQRLRAPLDGISAPFQGSPHERGPFSQGVALGLISWPLQGRGPRPLPSLPWTELAVPLSTPLRSRRTPRHGRGEAKAQAWPAHSKQHPRRPTTPSALSG